MLEDYLSLFCPCFASGENFLCPQYISLLAISMQIQQLKLCIHLTLTFCNVR